MNKNSFDDRVLAMQQILNSDSPWPERLANNSDNITLFNLPTDYDSLNNLARLYTMSNGLANKISDDSNVESMSDEDCAKWNDSYNRIKNTFAKILSDGSDDFFTEDTIDPIVYDEFKDYKDLLKRQYNFIMYGYNALVDDPSEFDKDNMIDYIGDIGEDDIDPTELDNEDVGFDLDGDGEEDFSTDLDDDGEKDFGVDVDGDGEDDTDTQQDAYYPEAEDKDDKDDTMKNIISSLSDKKF